jgi:drug/metabolite transporter (DMT)-like permease
VALVLGGRFLPPHPADWGWIAALAVGSGGVGHLLINWAHDHVDLSVMSVMTLAVPVVAVVSAAVFLDEPILGNQVFGMAIVLVSLGVVVVRTSRAPVPVPEIDPEPLVH